MQIQNKDDRERFSFQRNVAVVGVFLFVAKIFAWYLTNSDAVFSDAMESTVNIIAAFMGLYSLYLASKPRDEGHPYGHGKVEFITSAMEGGLIVFAGIMIIAESIYSLVQGNQLNQLDWGIAIIAFTGVVNYIMGYLSYRKGVRENSLVLQSSGKHLQSDTITTLGVVLSLVLVYFTKINWIDAAVAFIFGGYIIFVGYGIIRKSFGRIMDEADWDKISEVVNLLNQHRKKEWIDVHNTKIQHHGANLHIDGHITLPHYFDLRKAHSEMEEMVTVVGKQMDCTIEFNFHMDDCKPFSCEICLISDCPFRQKDFLKKIEWNVENISQIQKHTVGN